MLCCCCLTFWFCSSLSLSLSLPRSCQSADLWLCLSEGHTYLQTLLFVSARLHFSTLPPLKAARNKQKLTLGSYARSKVGFVALPRVVAASGSLTGLHGNSLVALTKRLVGPVLCFYCQECVRDVEK